jgi:hypothetical protein
VVAFCELRNTKGAKVRETMTNQKALEVQDVPREGSENSPIQVQVERFPVVKPKFSKHAWDSGEGGGEGEGEGEGEG